MEEQKQQLILDLPDLIPSEPGQDEVTELVAEALNRLQAADRRAALWRLLDAAGLLCEQYPDDPTVHEGTGRGYRVTRSGGDFVVGPACRQPSLPDVDLPVAGHYWCAAGPAA